MKFTTFDEEMLDIDAMEVVENYNSYDATPANEAQNTFVQEMEVKEMEELYSTQTISPKKKNERVLAVQRKVLKPNSRRRRILPLGYGINKPMGRMVYALVICLPQKNQEDCIENEKLESICERLKKINISKSEHSTTSNKIKKSYQEKFMFY